MLELRPNCELCDVDLPPQAENAHICSYECTFCTDCVDSVLHNVCPNCGGGFTRRPIRPQTARRDGVSLGNQPPGTTRKHAKYSREEIADFVSSVANIPPAER